MPVYIITLKPICERPVSQVRSHAEGREGGHVATTPCDLGHRCFTNQPINQKPQETLNDPTCCQGLTDEIKKGGIRTEKGKCDLGVTTWWSVRWDKGLREMKEKWGHFPFWVSFFSRDFSLLWRIMKWMNSPDFYFLPPASTSSTSSASSSNLIFFKFTWRYYNLPLVVIVIILIFTLVYLIFSLNCFFSHSLQLNLRVQVGFEFTLWDYIHLFEWIF